MPDTLDTRALVAHIVANHHERLRKTLPYLNALAIKVRRVHGAHNPRLVQLAEVVGELTETLLAHLDEEDESVFPALTAAERDGGQARELLASMRSAHVLLAGLLERIRQATEDYTVPDWACGSYRSLFSELRDLETEVFVNVRLENDALGARFA